MTKTRHIMVGTLGWVVCLSIGIMSAAAEPASDKPAAQAWMETDLHSLELAALASETPFMEFERPEPLGADREIWNEVRLRGSEHGLSVAVTTEFSTWSDLTSVFRPSRWKNPVRPGGPLSFLNLECWLTEPGRTAKTFVGTAVVVGGIAAVTSGSSGGGNAKEAAVSLPAADITRPTTSVKPDATSVESTATQPSSFREPTVAATSPEPAPAPPPPAEAPPSGGFVEEL